MTIKEYKELIIQLIKEERVENGFNDIGEVKISERTTKRISSEVRAHLREQGRCITDPVADAKVCNKSEQSEHKEEKDNNICEDDDGDEEENHQYLEDENFGLEDDI